MDAAEESAFAPNRKRPRKRTAHVLTDLVFVLTARDIKIKYKQSVMGLMWALAKLARRRCPHKRRRLNRVRLAPSGLAPRRLPAWTCKRHCRWTACFP